MDNLQVPEPDAKRARVDDTNGVEQPASPMDVEVDTTMLFATHNEPGALMAVLAHFRASSIEVHFFCVYWEEGADLQKYASVHEFFSTLLPPVKFNVTSRFVKRIDVYLTTEGT